MNLLLVITLAGALAGLLFALANARWVLAQPRGPEPLQLPYRAIREGAAAFMRTQYGIVALVGLALALLLWLVPGFGPLTAAGFLLGGICSGLAGVLGMWVAVRANVRTAAAAGEGGLDQALALALRSGSVTGFLVGGLALAAVGGFWLFLQREAGGDLRPLAGLGFGASLISIFSRLGGGIFTKAADVGADLAGKIEQGIPEDDPRNPAVIADNVGDNVGDCAGMAADVFESYAVTLVAAMLVARAGFPAEPAAQLLPLALGGGAALAAIPGLLLALRPARGGPLMAITGGLLGGVLLAAAGYALICLLLAPAALGAPWHLAGSALLGLLVGAVMVLVTDYYTSARFRPVQRIVHASASGHATNIIAGLAAGMRSTALPTLVVALAIVAAWHLAGVYGIALAAVGLLALTPLVVSIDAFGPVTDNAGGIVEMAGLPGSARNVTDALDAVGNTTKALTKVFAIGSAGMAALVLFVAFKMELVAGLPGLRFGIGDPDVLAGLLIGSLLPFVFSGLSMESVGRAASAIVLEVRRQFRERPGILKGEELPDYGHAVAFLTATSVREMVIPGLLPVLTPVAIALAWGLWGAPGDAAQAMGGALIGSICSGLLMALMLCTGGAAWDNTKKWIEAGHEGGKGSPAHHAAVTGDTVGDPSKDTAGPAINPMIKVLNLVALLLVPWLA